MQKDEVLVQKKGGVCWYVSQQGHNTVNRMTFEDGCTLYGSWCNARCVFRALSSMSPEERVTLALLDDVTHDPLKAAISARIRSK